MAKRNQHLEAPDDEPGELAPEPAPAAPAAEAKVTSITLKIDPGLIARLRMHALHTGIDVSPIVADLIAAHVPNYAPTPAT